MIKSKAKMRKPEIDLTGPMGNAFYLLATASKLCKDLKIDFKPIEKEMTSSDYENLINVFDKYFGAYVDLFR
jgi:hypothetical protein